MLILPASAAGQYTYTARQVDQLVTKFNDHGWVLKQGFWANNAVRNSLIKPLQTMLKELGYGSLSVDGSFGSATTKAVKNFQGKNNLSKDGIVGRKTWDTLTSQYRNTVEGTNENNSSNQNTSGNGQYTYQASEVDQLDNNFEQHGWVLKQGFWANKRSMVKPLQTMLKELGYGSLSIDGDFGSSTTKAVKEFQGKNGLSKDGIVGRKTWYALTSQYRNTVGGASSSDSESANTSSSGYDASAALAYAKDNVYKNSNQYCAEYVSRALKAGGVQMNVEKGVRGVRNALDNSGMGEFYQLSINRDGTVRMSQNDGKISPGDPIVIYCKRCDKVDGAPWVYTVLVSDTNGNGGVKVYAHNRAYNNQVYSGFNACGYYGHGQYKDAVAYVYHFN